MQAQSQLKALYKDNCDTIIGNCDSSVFLGGKEPTTLKELSAALGKETIDTFNTGESRGREVSHSLNYQKLGKDLATVDELAGEEEATSYVMACSCATNVAGGGAIANAEVEGVSLETLVQMACA